jgi:hypothetical protein
VTHSAAGSGRFGCAVSLRQDAYWVGARSGPSVNKHNLGDGTALNIPADERPVSLSITVDRKFVLFVGGSTFDTPLTTIDVQTDEIVDTGDYFASDVAVCDDGTIVTSKWDVAFNARLATYNINGTGHLTELAAVNGRISHIACSPSSAFVVAYWFNEWQLRSFAVSTLSHVASMILSEHVSTIVFNPTTAGVYVLHHSGLLSVYAFDTITGMFGLLQASVNVGTVSNNNDGFDLVQFAFGKLFVSGNDRLKTYDASLNLISSELVAGDQKVGICVSEGAMCRVSMSTVFSNVSNLCSLCMALAKQGNISMTPMTANIQVLILQ